MEYGKAIYQAKDYILVAIITAIVVIQIYPYTVRNGSLSDGYDNDLDQSSGYISAWSTVGLDGSPQESPSFRWPEFMYGLSEVGEQRRLVILPDGVNAVFVMEGYNLERTDRSFGNAKHTGNELSHGWMSWIGNKLSVSGMRGGWRANRKVPSPISSWLKSFYGSLSPLIRSIEEYSQPLLHRVEYLFSPGTAVNLADATREARMFSLLMHYDYGPCSFLPPHYSNTPAEDEGLLRAMLKWWYRKLGHDDYEAFTMAKAFRTALEVNYVPLLVYFLMGNILCFVTFSVLTCKQKNCCRHLNTSSRIPPIKDLDGQGNTVSLQFKTHGVLAYGAYGKVQVIRQKGSKKNYVLKTVKKVDTGTLDIKVRKSMADLQTVRCLEQIYVERRILTLARDCPFLSHLLWAAETDVYMHFITPMHRGGDLLRFLKVHRRLDESTTQFIAVEVVCALEFLHRHGVVHRDLKLDNIVVDADGHIRLIDFGLAAENVFNSNRRLYEYCGSPMTMAPEILNYELYNESCDWWALGVIMYWMYTGQAPFDGDTNERIAYKIRKQEPVWDECAGYKLKDCALWLMEKDPTFRLGMPGCPVGGIREQAFFDDIDWDLANSKELPAPYLLGVAPMALESDEKQRLYMTARQTAIKFAWFKKFHSRRLSTVSENQNK